MKKILYYILLVFAVLWKTNSQCQNSFQFLITSSLEDRISNLIETSDGGFLAIGWQGQWGGISEDHRGILYEIDKMGDTIGHVYQRIDTAITFFEIIPDSLFGYIVLGTIAIAPEYKEQLMFGAIDQDFSLKIINCIKTYEYEYILSINYIKNCVGYNVFVGVMDQQTNYNHFFIANLSLNGDSLNSKLFNYLGHGVDVCDVIDNKDNNQIWMFGNGLNGTSGTSLVKFNDNYNIISSEIIPEFSVYPYVNALWFSDSTLLFGGKYVHPGSNPQDDDIGLCITDTTFNNLELHLFGSIDTIDYPGWEDFIDFNHKDTIFFAGTHNNIFDFFPQQPSWIMAGQLDQELSSRNIIYYGGDAYYVTMDLLATKDGGCLISAIRYDYLTQDFERDACIIKFNKEDIITSTNEMFIEGYNQIVAYPNPGKQKLSIKSEHSGQVFTLYNIEGNALCRIKLTKGVTSINTSCLHPGIYVYSVESSEGLLLQGKWVKSND